MIELLYSAKLSKKIEENCIGVGISRPDRYDDKLEITRNKSTKVCKLHLQVIHCTTALEFELYLIDRLHYFKEDVVFYCENSTFLEIQSSNYFT